MDITSIALALGSSLTAGFNVYLTVLTLGVMQRLEWLSLPEPMQVVANPWVMGTAAVLVLVEFLADKIPYIDNIWDTVHTFVRVPAGAVLAAAAIGDVRPEYLWIAALVGGFVSFSAHGAKSSTRLAVNASPEPISNWVLSFGEDAVTLGLLWLVSSHPYIAAGATLVLLAVCVGVIYVFFRFLKMLFRRKPATASG